MLEVLEILKVDILHYRENWGAGATPNPCLSATYGETEDYCVTVTPFVPDGGNTLLLWMKLECIRIKP